MKLFNRNLQSFIFAKFFTLALLTSFIDLSPAGAEQITIATTASAEVNEATKSAKLTFVIRNDGDTAAREISVELPQQNKSFPVASELLPKGETKFATELSFSELGVSLSGSYIIPARIGYKDGNYYPFTASAFIHLVSPPAAAQAVHVRFLEHDPLQPIELRGSGNVLVEAEITNVNVEPVTVERIYPFSSAELKLKLMQSSAPKVLQPGEDFKVELQISNQGGIIGSQYALSLIVTGQSTGRNFADLAHIRVSLLGARVNSSVVIYGLIGLLGIAVIYFAVSRLTSR